MIITADGQCEATVGHGRAEHQCKSLAAKTFEYAPHGTGPRVRERRAVCTRHYNAIVLGIGNWDGYTYIVTKP